MGSALKNTSQLFGQLVPHGADVEAQRDPRISFELNRSANDELDVQFTLHGAIDDLCLPPWSRALRADGLWNHSCFELFVGPVDSPSYCEFNFAPTGGWAAYQFDRYREGMQNLSGIGNPVIETEVSADTYRLGAHVALHHVEALSCSPIWRLGISAIIEDKSGAKTYWALAHPAGKADFHHADCFSQTLKRPDPL